MDRTIGGTDPQERNIISANGGSGISISGAGAESNLILGNFIGTDLTGDLARGNSLDGVRILESPTNTVGGNVAGAGNLISANGAAGVSISGATGNNVLGNLIGTNSDGSDALGNGLNGVSISESPDNHVGGTAGGDRNVISGNSGPGVSISGAGATGNNVLGNLIGTKSNGSDPLGNGLGVSISGSPDNVIGGGGAGNVISGNLGVGVSISGAAATGNEVLGNFIGTNLTGSTALGNSQFGLDITDNASFNLIGGSMAGEGNVISANGGGGIRIAGTGSNGAEGNKVRGNMIGTDITGLIDRGNLGPGVIIAQVATDNLIGGMGVTEGTCDGSCNTVAFNDGEGILVESGSGTQILSNSIFNNAGLGIDLAPLGVAANDPGDGDTGVNGLQNFPQITTAADSIIGGGLNSTANTDFRIEFFSSASCDLSGKGEGQTFLGFIDVATDGSGDVGFVFPTTVPVGQPIVTATATDPNGNTSEFSSCVPVGHFVVNFPGNQPDGDSNDSVCDTGNAGAGFTGLCTLRAAITESNAAPVLNTLAFNIPGACPHTIGPRLQFITDPVIINGYTEPGSQPNTSDGIDAVLCIELAGAGLRIENTGSGSTIRGLVVNQVSGSGIFMFTSGGNTIQGNFVGTNVAGTAALPNSQGITMILGSHGNLIAEPTPRTATSSRAIPAMEWLSS